MSYLLKGSDFLNRYRITGQLKTLSPLHIGTGEESSVRLGKPAAPESGENGKGSKAEDDIPKVSTIIKDWRGKPLIPGSSLRGVMRHWLLEVLRGINKTWANVLDEETQERLLALSQEEQIEEARTNFSLLELLFGTPFNAGKLEVWDAKCLTQDLAISDTLSHRDLLHWDANSLTYVDTSVAIDPETGTALDKLLYQAEVVPAGVSFELNIVGQNLAEEELGLVLLALEGFNSNIYPIRIGARGGRGFGRMEYIPGDLYELNQGSLSQWIQDSIHAIGREPPGPAEAAKTGDAGYFALPQLDKSRQQALIAQVKAKLIAGIGK